MKLTLNLVPALAPASITVPVIRHGRTPISACEPPRWQFYEPETSTFVMARPVACWTDDKGDWIEAHTDVSKKTGKQYRLTSLYVEREDLWAVIERTEITDGVDHVCAVVPCPDCGFTY